MQAVVGSTRSSANSANLRFRVNISLCSLCSSLDPPERSSYTQTRQERRLVAHFG